jgi:hypothetical protein
VDEYDGVEAMITYGEEQAQSALDILREKMKKKELKKVRY